MVRKIFIFLVLTAISAGLFLTYRYVDTEEVLKFAYSFATVAGLYLVFNIVIGQSVARKVSSEKMRYAIRKSVSLLFIILSGVVVLRIFVPDPQALLVAYGLMGAGIAIALQDVFKNFAGSITIFISGLYGVGDRVEVSGVYGDVIDVSLFYTTLLEIREWVEADQATGRLLTIPNGVALSGMVKNYTKYHPFLWDELSVVVTPESDWQMAMEILLRIANEKTESFIAEGKESLSKLSGNFYVDSRSFEPRAYLSTDSNGNKLSLRYVVNAKQRRRVNSDMWEAIIPALDEHPDIAVAPVTFASVPSPQVGQ